MNPLHRRIFALMTRCEREQFERMGGSIPRDIRTCVPEWRQPTQADRVADEVRQRRNRIHARSRCRCRRRKRRPAVKKPGQWSAVAA
jgi:hypothetical protein